MPIWAKCSVFSMGKRVHDWYYNDDENVGSSLMNQIWTQHTFSYNPHTSPLVMFAEFYIERIKAPFWLYIAINKLPENRMSLNNSLIIPQAFCESEFVWMIPVPSDNDGNSWSAPGR